MQNNLKKLKQQLKQLESKNNNMDQHENVHLKVLDSDEKKTGITIHYVNEEYDSGGIIFQKEIELSDAETLETLREKIREIEYYYFPRIIKNLL